MGRIIRTCSLIALAMAVQSASARGNDPSALGAYARARISPTAEQAASNYAAALTAAPDNATVAFRAYREAVNAGDFALALRAAQAMERDGAVPSEARLLLYVAALRTRDWQGAAMRLNDVALEPTLSFIAPVLGDWLALASGAPVVLPAGKATGGRNAYSQESSGLILLARGRTDDGLDVIKTLWTLDPYRAQSLRIAAASTLADRKEYDRALALLAADDHATVQARAQIGARRKLGVSVDSPASGAAFVIARMAGDLITEGSGRAAVTLARFAQFADPKNPRIALIAAGALMAANRPEAAMALADRLRTDPVYGDDAMSLRIDLLDALGRADEAVAGAVARADRSGNDLARVADLEMRRGRFAAAAEHYRQAIAIVGVDKVGWNLWHAAGNAMMLGGDWAAARPALERALILAPDQPLVLNSLGFGLIDNREEMQRATAMLDKAARLQPESAAITDSIGWAAYRVGRFDDAVETLERAVALDQSQAEIGEHLGDAYWAAGRRVDARYAWTAARVQAEGAAAVRLDGKIDRGLP